MWELFGVIFATLGFIFELQEGFGLPSGALKGVFVLFSDFGCNLGVHVAPLLASILGCFFLLILGSVLGAIPGRLRMDFGAILAQCWLHFGSLLGSLGKSEN